MTDIHSTVETTNFNMGFVHDLGVISIVHLGFRTDITITLLFHLLVVILKIIQFSNTLGDCYSCTMSISSEWQALTGGKPTLLQVRAWCHESWGNKPLPEPMLIKSMTQWGITRGHERHCNTAQIYIFKRNVDLTVTYSRGEWYTSIDKEESTL